jgi:membrane protease YdiL (CAAX protease family)
VWVTRARYKHDSVTLQQVPPPYDAAPPVPAPAPQPERRPTVWPVLAAYVVALVAMLVVSAVFVIAGALVYARGDTQAILDPTRLTEYATKFALSVPGLLGSAAIDAAILLAVALTTTRLMGRDVVARLRLGPSRATPVGLIGATVGLAGLSLAGGGLADLAGLGKTGVMQTVRESLAHPGPVGLAAAIVALAVAPGVAEETFFRGFVQTRFAARLGRWPAIFLSALSFGVFHLDPVQGSLAFLLGIYLGWMAERFEGIRPGMLAHAFNNALFVVASSLGGDDEPGSRAAAASTLAVGVVVCAGATLLVRSRFSVRPTPRAS